MWPNNERKLTSKWPASKYVHRPKVHLALPARWPYSEYGSPRRSGQLSQFRFVYVTT